MAVVEHPHNSLDRAIDEFTAQIRRGEEPAIADYAARYSKFADEIDRLFPVVLLMERSRRDMARPSRVPQYVPERLGDYEIVREVGRGGMGVVYEARQISLQRRVALKMLPTAASLRPELLERFRHEAIAAARLHHTNIVQVHGIGDSDRHHYYIMQFITGRSLAELCAQKHGGDQASDETHSESATLPDNVGSGTSSPRPPRSNVPSAPDRAWNRFVAQVGLQAAEALAYAHAQGVLHRDIKPSNLIIDSQNTVWITDFGLAKIEGTGDLTATGDVPGTVRYLAPERLRGESDARSDVFSLGLVLYELLLGRPAYDAKDRNAMLRQVIEASPPAPRRLAPAISRELETIVLTCLQHDPARRYQSAGELADDCRRYCEDRPIAARRTSAVERAWRWCRRHPQVAIPSGTLLLLLATMAVVAPLVAIQQASLRQRADALLTEKEQAFEQLDERNTDLHEQLIRNLFERATAEYATGTSRNAIALLAGTYEIVPPDHPLHTSCLNLMGGWSTQIGHIWMHKGKVWIVACSPDGRTLLTGGTGRLAELWDVESGKRLVNPLTHGGTVAAAAFSPDGHTLLTGSMDEMARLWDVSTGKTLCEPLRHSGYLRYVAFNPNGNSVLTSNERAARLWDARSGKPLSEFLPLDGAHHAIAFSPDGQFFLVGGRAPQVYDAATGQPVGEPLSSGDLATACAFSPDGRTMLIGGTDGAARLWNLQTRRMVGKPLQHESPVSFTMFSPDGRTILIIGGRSAQLWDAQSLKPLSLPLRHNGRIEAFAFSPDSRMLITGGEDHAARLWESRTGIALADPFWHDSNVSSIAFSPDDPFVFTGSFDRTARMWNLQSAQYGGQSLLHPAAVKSVAVSSDGRTLATGCSNGSATVWNVKTGEIIAGPFQHSATVTSVAMSPDGRTLLTGSSDHTARLWNIESGKARGEPLPHPAEIEAVTFSPDGRLVLTGSRDAAARLWEARTGQLVGDPLIHRGIVWDVAFESDGRSFWTGVDTSQVTHWDGKSRKSIGEPIADEGTVYAVAINSDDRFLLIGGETGIARLWNAKTKVAVGRPLQHDGQITAAVFHPDGLTVATASTDHTARLCDAHTGVPRCVPLRHPAEVTSLAFTPDGNTIVTGCNDGQVRFWPVPMPIDDNPELIHEWVKAHTGLELDAQGSVQPVAPEVWLESLKTAEVLQRAAGEKRKLEAAQVRVAATMPAEFDESLVGYWNLEEGAGAEVHDQSGNLHHGKILAANPNACWSTNVPPIIGNQYSLRLEGNEQHVEVPDEDGLDLADSFTISVWINTIRNTPSWDRIVDKNERAGGYKLSLAKPDGRVLATLSTPPNGDEIYSKARVNDGGWHHIACVYGSKKLLIYVDGKLNETKSAPRANLRENDSPLLIGIRHEFPGSPKRSLPFHGWIDELRIYRRPLGEAEIRQLYRLEMPGGASRPKSARG